MDVDIFYSHRDVHGTRVDKITGSTTDYWSLFFQSDLKTEPRGSEQRVVLGLFQPQNTGSYKFCQKALFYEAKVAKYGFTHNIYSGKFLPVR